MPSSSPLPTITLLPPLSLSTSPPPPKPQVYIAPLAICGSVIIAVITILCILHFHKNKPILNATKPAQYRESLVHHPHSIMLPPYSTARPEIRIIRPDTDMPFPLTLPPATLTHQTSTTPYMEYPSPEQTNYFDPPLYTHHLLTPPSPAQFPFPAHHSPVPARPESPLTAMRRVKLSERTRDADPLHTHLDSAQHRHQQQQQIQRTRAWAYQPPFHEEQDATRASFVSDSYTVWSEIEEDGGIDAAYAGRRRDVMARSVLPLPERFRGSEIRVEQDEEEVLDIRRRRIEGDEY
ncbi:unnamed protein product [Periconia digitata]|uniref:Uncharacterized protein n=1 Tax=Periconia digitata TaxID=1303443 RepID=A0A9W4UIR1_9PLEO|nr:unnamed protein product [Periconia digitata]